MVAVLIIAFNRPDLLRKTLDSLISMRGIGKIYVHVDGPRENIDRDFDLTVECRTLTLLALQDRDSVTLFQKENLGGKVAIQNAIDWFFSREDFGLIVEDDVIIHHEVPFILEKVFLAGINTREIGTISLHNPLPENFQPTLNLNTKVSIYPLIWGWAAWAQTWRIYERNIEDGFLTIAYVVLRQRHLNLVAKKYWLLKFLNSRTVETWDTQLLYAHWKNNLKTLTFNVNLASNMGFDERATRTKTHRKIEEIFSGELRVVNLEYNCFESDDGRDRALGKVIWGLSYQDGFRNLVKRLMRLKNQLLPKRIRQSISKNSRNF
jgi:hypothetical protein